MIRKKIKVFIVEDSKVYSEYLKKIIDKDPMLEVVGIAENAKTASEMIAKILPDVITLDLSLPDVRKFELLEKLVKDYGKPIIVVTSLPKTCEAALAAGAKDFIEKIQSDSTMRSRQQFEMLLKLKLKTQANTPMTVHTKAPKRPMKALPCVQTQNKIIAVGASLGGTEIIMKILSRLPADLPSIIVVQHMPKGFTNAYALRLQQNCKMQVCEAKQGDLIIPGKAYIAPGGRQLTIVKKNNVYQIALGGTEKFGGFCPSVDVMFHSVAAEIGSDAVGIILTGMGRDGAKGMKSMHDAGAFTIGQDEESCAVFGMPQAAYQAGGVDVLLNPEQITDYLCQYSIAEINKGAGE